MNPTLVILLVGSFVAASCSMVGSFLVLRRMALLGDAISHAVLPGIVIAFLLTGHRTPVPMILGAAALGLLTVFVVESFHRSGRLAEDASIGVVFPALFSVGVLLVSRYAAQVDLDLDCVLHGEIAYAPWDTWRLGGRSMGPKALWVTGSIFSLVLAFVLAFYKELKLAAFDPALAESLGLSPGRMHYVLMAAVSVTVVGSFESVGAILVVAMLVVPPATAYLLTDRLPTMLALSAGLGVVSTGTGYALARWLDCSIAGAMACTAGLFFAAAFLFSPSHGLIGRVLATRTVEVEIAGEMVLAHLANHRAVPLADLEGRFGWQPSRLRRVVRALRRDGRVCTGPEGLTRR